jgi:hypothetical protein
MLLLLRCAKGKVGVERQGCNSEQVENESC